MRYYWLIFSIFLGLSAQVSFAEAIVVRSGAHDGFSRLVLNVRPNTDWSMTTNESSARLTLQGHESGFDTRGVFSRIDNTHIENVSGVGSVLDVEFSCECTVNAFEQGDRMIVLDISDSTKPTSASQDRKFSPVVVGLPASQPFQFGNQVARPSASAPVSLPTTWSDESSKKPGVSMNQPLLDVQDIDAETKNSLAQAQQRIAEQVGTAATRGLLKPKAKPIELPLVQNRPQIDVEIFDSSSVEATRGDENPAPKGGNLKITSSADIPNGADMSPIATTMGVRCIDPATTDIQTWASDTPFSVQIAERRNALFSEFDRLDRNAAVDLARTYLHFGFGLEARDALLLDPAVAEENPALLEMAEILEFGHSKRPSYLHHFMECDSNVALWAILSKQNIEPAETLNANAALRAVTALPMHLRSFIAPELSRRLLNYGAADDAAAALRSLERAAQPLSSDANLAKADLEMAEGNIAQAQDRLEQVVTSNVEQSAEALIKFVDSHLEADAEIEQEVATLVEAYALQMRDDPIGAELRRTHVLALGKSGQFDAAFDALTRIRDRRNSQTDQSVVSTLLSLLTRNGSDIEFLDHIFQHMRTSLRDADAKTRVDIADRLVSIGFATEAEDVLASLTDTPDDEASRLVRARVALALARPFEAEALVFGLDSKEANILRAQAKAKSGAFDQAHTLFSQVEETEGRQQMAWLADDWTNLVEPETPVLGSVARIAQTSISEETATEGMLARTVEAISESAQARSVIEELLRTSNPDAD